MNEIKMIQDSCGEAMERFGYKFIKTQTELTNETFNVMNENFDNMS